MNGNFAEATEASALDQEIVQHPKNQNESFLTLK